MRNPYEIMSHISPLKTIQNKAIKNLYNLPHRYNTSDLYNVFKIRGLKSLNVVKVNEFIHQVINQVRYSQIQFFLNKNFTHMEYNKLPIDIKSLDFKQFKIKMRKHVSLNL